MKARYALLFVYGLDVDAYHAEGVFAMDGPDFFSGGGGSGINRSMKGRSL
jgi:hypothetical protein